MYGPIYTLNLMKLETLKAYIETHLKTGFIWSSQSPTGALMIFNIKPDSNFYLCVNYRGLNNLAIKNQYSLLLIGETQDQLGLAKQFTQLDLTSVYH